MLRPLLAAALALSVVHGADNSTQYYRYVVVGAGLGGLQIAHYLDSAGRNYVLLEAQSSAASLIQNRARFDRLRAINKADTGSDYSIDLNLKYDEVSLLSEPSHSAVGVAAAGAADVAPAPCLGLPPAAYSQYGEYDDSNYTEVPIPDCVVSDFSSTDPRFTVGSLYDEKLRLGGWTREYLPQPTALVEYARWWAGGDAPRGRVAEKRAAAEDTEEHEEDEDDVAALSSKQAPFEGRPLNIRYKARVAKVARPVGYDSSLWSPVDSKGMDREALIAAERTRAVKTSHALTQGTPRFSLKLADGTTITCTYLVWAAGQARDVAIEGINTTAAVADGVAHSYETAPLDPSAYWGKAVVILGSGREAHEVASYAVQHAAVVHMVRPPQPSWDEYGINPIAPSSSLFLTRAHVVGGEEASLIDLSGPGVAVRRSPHTGLISVGETTGRCSPDYYRRESNDCAWRREYDVAIVAGGWTFDPRPFGKGAVPALAGPGTAPGMHDNRTGLVYAQVRPVISPSYESVNVPGLYFAGSLAEGAAWARARYHARALHRVLEEQEQAAAAATVAAGYELPSSHTSASATASASVSVSADGSLDDQEQASQGEGQGQEEVPAVSAAGWPRRRLCGLRAAVDALLRRASTSSGLFHSGGGLADVLVLPPLPQGAQPAADWQGMPLPTALEEPWTYSRRECPPLGSKGAPPSMASPVVPEDDLSPATALFFPAFTGPRWAHPDAKEEHPAVMAAAKAENASMLTLDWALTGYLVEEVPTGLVQARAGQWAVQALADDERAAEAVQMASTMEQVRLGLVPEALPPITGPSGKPQHQALQWPEYITLTLEHGCTTLDCGQDGDKVEPSNASLATPWYSAARHPVLRYYHAGLVASGADSRRAGLPGVEAIGRSPSNDLVRTGNSTNSTSSNSSLPVLKPYAGPLGPAPVWECHLKADGHGDYSSHMASVLPLARCLQALAARRVEAARAAARASPELVDKAGKSSKPKKADGNATDPNTRALQAVRSVWALPQEADNGRVLPTGPHSHEIAQLMSMPQAVLWCAGHRIQGGPYWWIRASHAGLARIASVPLLVLHVLDPLPVDISNREKSFTAAVAHVQQGKGPYRRLLANTTATNATEVQYSWTNLVTNRSSLPPWTPADDPSLPTWRVIQAAALTLAAPNPDPFLDQEQMQSAATEEAMREAAYARLTRGAPGMALVSINARSGMERVWAETVFPPLPSIPTFRLRDWRRARLDLPGGVDDGGFEDMAAAVNGALNALQDGKQEPELPKTLKSLNKGKAKGGAAAE